MKMRMVNFGLCFLLSVARAWGSPLISVEDQYMLNTDAERTFAVLVSSGTSEHVEAAKLYVQIGDGGTINDGTDTTPRVTGLDLVGTGTIFHASNTGATPFYLSLSGNSPYLIASSETTTTPGTSVAANGVLAYITVNAAGATVGSAYRIDFQNVAANYTGGPWVSDFGDISASFSPSLAYIHIVDLHQTIWNGGADGAWTNHTWTGSAPPYPNYTCQTIVDTPYMVSIISAQESDSLSLSGNGGVSISSAGSLTLSTSAAIAGGSILQVAGTLKADDISLDGSLNFSSGGSGDLGTITGTGTMAVGDGSNSSNVTITSMTGGLLSIAAGSVVTIRAITGEPLSGVAALKPVPEPSTALLLFMAVLLFSALGKFVRPRR